MPALVAVEPRRLRIAAAPLGTLMQSIEVYRNAANIKWTTVVVLMALAQAQPSFVQGDVFFHGGPTFDGTNGYHSPSFHHDDVSAFPQASWQLLNDAGMAAWSSDYDPSNANHFAIRFHPPTGPPVQLPDPATGANINPTSNPYAINSSGTVVGQARNSFNHDLPVRWNAAGTPTILQTLTTLHNAPPRPGGANDINDNGIAVGWSGRFHPTISLNLGDRAVRWDAAGNVMELGQVSFQSVPCGENTCSIAYSEAYAVNNSGVAVGRAVVFDATESHDGDRAVRWNSAGVATQLGHLGTENSPTSADTLAAAWAVNETGDAVGFAYKYNAGMFKGTRAVRWNHDSTAALELGLLGTAVNGVSSSKAYTINNVGTAVGWVVKYDEHGVAEGLRGVTWDTSGQVTELQSLQSTTNAAAIDVNDDGVAVGWSDSPSGRQAVLWRADGSVLNLNTLLDPNDGWQLTEALAISNTGWIAGLGDYDPDEPSAGQFPYRRVFMMQIPAEVPLVGDYNDDGDVDAADYVLWRKLDDSHATLPNDQTPGWVNDDDRRLWLTHFGESASETSISSGSVPEPGALASLLLAFGAMSVRRFAPVKRAGLRRSELGGGLLSIRHIQSPRLRFLVHE